MATPTIPGHRVSAAVAQMRDTATAVAHAPVWSMTDHEAADALVELTHLEAQLAELKAASRSRSRWTDAIWTDTPRRVRSAWARHQGGVAKVEVKVDDGEWQ